MLRFNQISLDSSKNGFREIDDPTREDIFTFARMVESDFAEMTVIERGGKKSHFCISSEEGAYYLVDATSRNKRLVMLVDKRVAVPTSPAEYETVSINGNETLKHNTITDFDVILSMLDRYIETGDLFDKEPFTWLDVLNEGTRFKF